MFKEGAENYYEVDVTVYIDHSSANADSIYAPLGMNITLIKPSSGPLPISYTFGVS